MSGTPTRLTMRSGRLRSSIVSAKEPLVTARTSLKPPWARAACIAASAVRSGSIKITRGIVASGSRPRRRRDGERLDQLDEARLVDRLGHVVLHAQLASEVDVLGAGPRGQDHDREVTRARLAVEVADQLVAVEARHLQVHDDDVDRLLREQLQRFRAVPGGDDVEPGTFEHSADEPAHADRVVDEQDAALGLSGRRGDRLALATRVAGARPGRRRTHLEKPQRVEQQDDLPLSGHGRAGEGPDALQEGAEILDHDLFLAEELVHDHGERLAPGAEGDDRQRPSVSRPAIWSTRSSRTRSTLSPSISIDSTPSRVRISSGRRWIAPFTAGTGIARVCGPTFTMSASVIATVSGRRILKRVPCPASLCTSISPPRRLTFERTTSMPTPRPAAVVTDVAVVRPGRKIRSRMSRSPSRARVSAVTKPPRRAASATASTSIPRPSSATSM